MTVFKKTHTGIPVTGFQTNPPLDESFNSIAVCSAAEDTENRGKEWLARKFDFRFEAEESLGTLHLINLNITELFMIIIRKF